jgi:hypothetical protein
MVAHRCPFGADSCMASGRWDKDHTDHQPLQQPIRSPQSESPSYPLSAKALPFRVRFITSFEAPLQIPSILRDPLWAGKLRVGLPFSQIMIGRSNLFLPGCFPGSWENMFPLCYVWWLNIPGSTHTHTATVISVLAFSLSTTSSS